MAAGAISETGSGVLLRVKVQPRASREGVLDVCDEFYRVALTAPPVDGAANEALIRFLAAQLTTKRQHIILRSGKTSRLKTLEITGLDIHSVRERLESSMRKSGGAGA